MTHFKSTFMTTALVLACAAAPAFADHHAEGTMKKGDHMMKSGDAMMKPGTQAMTTAQRMAAEQKIISAMSDTDRAAFMMLSEKERKMRMNKQLMGGDYMAGNASMTSDTMSTGQVLQMNEPMNPTLGDGDVLMSNGATPDVDKVMAMEAQESDGTLMNNAIAVPTIGGNEVLTTVTCPVGAEAQPDGTCMLTGDTDLMFSTETSVQSSTMMNDTSAMTNTQMSTQYTGTFTTDGKPYMGTMDPASVFGNR